VKVFSSQVNRCSYYEALSLDDVSEEVLNLLVLKSRGMHCMYILTTLIGWPGVN